MRGGKQISTSGGIGLTNRDRSGVFCKLGTGERTASFST